MSEIAEQAQHRWVDILKSFGLDDRTLNGRHGPCPICEGKDRFRFTNYMGNGSVICNQCMPVDDGVDGFEFLMRYTGSSFAEIAKEVKDILGTTTARPAQGVDVSKNKSRLNTVWTDAKPLSKGCPTHRYLVKRGVKTEFGKLAGLRCHPALDYWMVDNGKPVNLGKHPAMVGLVLNSLGEPSTLHLTYLTKDGEKAVLDPVRKILPVSRPYKGGAVRLEPHTSGQLLCVAEGIETALSIKTLFPDVCCWACLTAGNMKDFIAPDDAATIYIAADNDLSYTGQAAAFELARKLSGKKFDVRVLMPAQIGTDWNDELLANEKLEGAA